MVSIENEGTGRERVEGEGESLAEEGSLTWSLNAQDVFRRVLGLISYILCWDDLECSGIA